MAKRPKTPPPTPEEVADLSRFVNEEKVFEVECCVCPRTFRNTAGSDEAFTRIIYRHGWRSASSERWQVEGAMCPKCFRTPDAERDGR